MPGEIGDSGFGGEGGLQLGFHTAQHVFDLEGPLP
jgi:hypothetical protein